MDLDPSQLVALGAWLYVAIAVVVALDAVLPVMPSEGAVIAGAVLAASGDASIALVLVAGAAGALAGDLGSFLVGRRVARRRGLVPDAMGGRTGRMVRWAQAQLAAHGPSTLLVCRFVPGGRTAATFTAGLTGMRARSFSATAALGASLWALQSAAIGFLGGHVFEGNLVLGIAVGVAGGFVVGTLVELVHRRRSTSVEATALATTIAPAPAPAAADAVAERPIAPVPVAA